MRRRQARPDHDRRITVRSKAFLLVVLGVFSPALASTADVVYSYTGPAFDAFVGVYSCAPVCRISGSFTLPTALPANRPSLPISPSSYRFTDGNQVFDPTTVQQVVAFQIGTDATGRPSAWDITLKTNTAAAVLPARALSTTHGGFERDISTQDGIQNVQSGGNASCSNCTPGTWSPATTVGTQSKGGAVLLLVIALIVIGRANRWRSSPSAATT